MSRVRENRMHGSTWRREETGTSRANTSRTEPGASRRPDRLAARTETLASLEKEQRVGDWIERSRNAVR